MKAVSKNSDGKNYTAVEVGKMNELSQYTLVLSPEIQIPGKVFLGTLLGTTGGEISFQSFAPNSETGFLHTHKTHEELYFFISGKGEFQVDDKVFTISEGSVVRVAPEGRRSVRNNSNDSLVMICVQYKANAFSSDNITDGVILADKVNW
ncbi:cupin domain-containing protein [Parabacteroides chinchillae]